MKSICCILALKAPDVPQQNSGQTHCSAPVSQTPLGANKERSVKKMHTSEATEDAGSQN